MQASDLQCGRLAQQVPSSRIHLKQYVCSYYSYHLQIGQIRTRKEKVQEPLIGDQRLFVNQAFGFEAIDH